MRRENLWESFAEMRFFSILEIEVEGKDERGGNLDEVELD
jgi:hypothetical protein